MEAANLEHEVESQLKLLKDKIWLGLDFSTQGLKASIISIREEEDGDGSKFFLETQPETYSVSFDVDLSHFGTTGGCHRQNDGKTVTAPPLMWVAALELLFDRMKESSFEFSRVSAISGAGQQHGSVFWSKGALEQSLSPLKQSNPLPSSSSSSSSSSSLHDHFQRTNAFSVSESPIWMDMSTTNECEEFEKRMGGSLSVAQLTGSSAHERFTGHQISKVRKLQHTAYLNTERISLVSSFGGSLLIGDYSPIDVSDGSGMNLMNLETKSWSREALEVVVSPREEENQERVMVSKAVEDLEVKLGKDLIESHQVIGTVSQFFVSQYGFSETTLVIAFSGDNPCSLAGLPPLSSSGVRPTSIAVSLGTSDTLFGLISQPTPKGEGHIFRGCVDPDIFMFLLCYSNGSLTREYIRDIHSQHSWTKFGEALDKTQPGNQGKIGFFFYVPEITPRINSGIYLFDNNNNLTQHLVVPQNNRSLAAWEGCGYSSDEVVRAVVEGQFLSMMTHLEQLGLDLSDLTTVVATGGASTNSRIVSILSDVVGVPVLTSEVSNSASVGSAYRAIHGELVHRLASSWSSSTSPSSSLGLSFSQVTKRVAKAFQVVAQPNLERHNIYKELLKRYKTLEQRLLESHKEEKPAH